jgi:hypothetical protein
MAVVSERMTAKRISPPIMDTLQGKSNKDQPKPPPPTLQQAAALSDPNKELIDQSNQGFFGSFFKQQQKGIPGQLTQVHSFKNINFLKLATFCSKGVRQFIRTRANGNRSH